METLSIAEGIDNATASLQEISKEILSNYGPNYEFQ